MFLQNVGPYALDPAAKTRYLDEQLGALIEHHVEHCAPYARLVEDWRRREMPGWAETAASYPFVPVTIFKEHDLRSTEAAGLSVKSSATTSGTSSRIFVDKATRTRQTQSASRVMADFIGSHRRPYIVFDLESSVRGAESLGARGAAILSLAPFASEFHFVMTDRGGELALDEEALGRAVRTIGDQPFIAYGFTWMLYQAHVQLASADWTAPAHRDSVLLHSGGWKKLTAMAVDKPTFNQRVADVWGLPSARVVDFYGAVEQVGVPYPDCAAGVKHVPYWAEVVIRRSDTLEPVGPGEVGLLQLINCLPLSAPNHSVLTEDLAELVCLDGCSCGRRGRAFVFKGRAPRAELRGCSDVPRG